MFTLSLPQKTANRRNFDDDLKLQVVCLVREQKKLPAVQVCRDFNISSSSLHRWLNHVRAAAYPRTRTRELVIAPGRGDPKKGLHLLRPGIGMIQTLIHRWQEKAQIKAPVSRLCALLGASRA